MKDKELAAAIVEKGIGSRSGDWYSVYNFVSYNNSLTASQFVRKWHVAGALMEKCIANEADWYHFSQFMLKWNHYGYTELDPGMANPRVICETYIEAQNI